MMCAGRVNGTSTVPDTSWPLSPAGVKVAQPVTLVSVPSAATSVPSARYSTPACRFS